MYNYGREDSNPDLNQQPNYSRPGPTLAQNINLNITNIIDDIKKQRMDIIKLNNEIKNSRGIMNQKSTDDFRNKNELMNIASSLKKERDHLLSELKNAKKRDTYNDSSKEKEMAIKELKNKKREYKQRSGDIMPQNCTEFLNDFLDYFKDGNLDRKSVV